MLSSTRYSPAADVVCNAAILVAIVIGLSLSPIGMAYVADGMVRHWLRK